MRATKAAAGRGRRLDSGRVPARPELGDDGRVPRVRERRGGEVKRVGMGKRKGKRAGGASWVAREKEKERAGLG